MRPASALLIAAVPLVIGGCGLRQTPASTSGQGSLQAPSPTITSSASPAPAPTPSPLPSAGSSQSGSATPGASLGSATNSSGWTTVVTASWGELQVEVTVRGPLTVMGGCDPSITAWAETPSGSRVATPTAAPYDITGPSEHCLAIALISITAGTTKTFSATIAEPPQPGTYTVVGTLNAMSSPGAAIPAVTITL
jgi:hypothetical protein